MRLVWKKSIILSVTINLLYIMPLCSHHFDQGEIKVAEPDPFMFFVDQADKVDEILRNISTKLRELIQEQGDKEDTFRFLSTMFSEAGVPNPSFPHRYDMVAIHNLSSTHVPEQECHRVPILLMGLDELSVMIRTRDPRAVMAIFWAAKAIAEREDKPE